MKIKCWGMDFSGEYSGLFQPNLPCKGSLEPAVNSGPFGDFIKPSDTVSSKDPFSTSQMCYFSTNPWEKATPQNFIPKSFTVSGKPASANYLQVS